VVAVALEMVRDESLVVRPTDIPPKLIEPVPAVRDRAFGPMIELANEISPAPDPVVIDVVPPPPVKVTGPSAKLMLLFVV